MPIGATNRYTPAMPKRIIAASLAVGMLLLVACGGGGDEEAPVQTVGPTATSVVAPAIPTETPSVAPAIPTETPSAAPTPTPLATEGDFFLQLVEPPETEIFTDAASLNVVGRTRVDALVTINDTIVEPNIDGEFSLVVALEEGPNIIEVVASVASGDQMDLVLVVIYLP